MDLASVESSLGVLIPEVEPVVRSGHVVDLLLQTLDFVLEIPPLLFQLLGQPGLIVNLLQLRPGVVDLVFEAFQVGRILVIKEII